MTFFITIKITIFFKESLLVFQKLFLVFTGHCFLIIFLIIKKNIILYLNRLIIYNEGKVEKEWLEKFASLYYRFINKEKKTRIYSKNFLWIKYILLEINIAKKAMDLLFKRDEK